MAFPSSIFRLSCGDLAVLVVGKEPQKIADAGVLAVVITRVN